MGYLYVIFTILFTVYGQVILKWRISDLNWSLDMTGGIGKMIVSYMKFLFDPLIFSGFISAFIASVFWMLAMTKFELTYAYPFMALSPALVFYNWNFCTWRNVYYWESSWVACDNDRYYYNRESVRMNNFFFMLEKLLS